MAYIFTKGTEGPLFDSFSELNFSYFNNFWEYFENPSEIYFGASGSIISMHHNSEGAGSFDEDILLVPVDVGARYVFTFSTNNPSYFDSNIFLRVLDEGSNIDAIFNEWDNAGVSFLSSNPYLASSEYLLILPEIRSWSNVSDEANYFIGIEKISDWGSLEVVASADDSVLTISSGDFNLKDVSEVSFRFSVEYSSGELLSVSSGAGAPLAGSSFLTGSNFYANYSLGSTNGFSENIDLLNFEFSEDVNFILNSFTIYADGVDITSYVDFNGIFVNDYFKKSSTYYGGDADQVFLSGGQSDTFYCLDGDDEAYGNDGNDSLYGQNGNDTLYGGNNNDKLYGGSGNDRSYGEAGNDSLYMDAGNDTLDGGSGTDWLYVTGRTNSVVNLAKTTGQNTGYGTDIIKNIENVSGGSGVDKFYGTSGNNTLKGNNGNDLLYGQSGNDKLYGGSGNDRSYGQSGNDSLYMDAGNDTLDGGSGTDWLYVTGSTNSVVNLAKTTSQNTGYGTDIIKNIENASGGSGVDKFYGTSGNNTLKGNNGNDLLYGQNGNDTLYGGNNNDRLYGGSGNDRMLGGSGNDTYYVDSTRDRVYETTSTSGSNTTDAGGTDRIYSTVSLNMNAYNGIKHVEHLTLQGSSNVYGFGNDNNNTITGNSGNNTLKGGSGNDVLRGGAGNDKLYGDAGNDRMLGGSGNDTYYVDSTRDRVYETTSTSGSNTTDAGGTDRIYSTVSLNMNAYNGIKHVEHLTLQGSSNVYGFGNDNNNTITGNSGNNTLKGRSGNDVLKGNAGRDTFEGGDGRDYMYAGNDADRDVFIFRDISESVKGSQRDRIYQFDSGEDDIHLRLIDANENLAGDQDFKFSSNGAAANSVWVQDSGSNVLVRGDVNGDLIHDFEIFVASVDDLYVYDFIL